MGANIAAKNIWREEGGGDMGEKNKRRAEWFFWRSKYVGVMKAQKLIWMEKNAGDKNDQSKR